MAQSDSVFLDLNGTDTLHVKRWYNDKAAPAVLLIHGSIENGRIFYAESGKGFAPWLADQGYDVFVPDLRGRGKSTPRISRTSDFGQMDMVNTDIPFLIDHVKREKGTAALWIGAHSWGGNLALASYARYPQTAHVKGFVFFGVKRRVTVWNMERIVKLNFGWRIMAPIGIKKDGFLNAVKLKMGADNETKRIFKETNYWLDNETWTDPNDGFDYGAAFKKLSVPPILSLTGVADKVLGHPVDCENLLKEANSVNAVFRMVGKASGNKHDYDHINILTHKDAAKDHFVGIKEWMDSI